MGIAHTEGRIEASMSDQINLEDSVASVIHGDRVIRKYEVAKRYHGLLAT